jgi:hypothetical protein
MRGPNPNAVAYVVRAKKHALFRRCGLDFTMEARRVEVAQLTPAQRQLLLDSGDVLEVEEVMEGTSSPPAGTPEEAIAAADAAGVSHPPIESPPRRGRR